MNNDNNQDKTTDLASLYGVSSNDNTSQPVESVNNQNVQVDNSIQNSENNISQPINNNLNQKPVQEPMVQNNTQLPSNNNKNNNIIIIIISIIVIGAIACNFLFLDKKEKEKPKEQNNPQQEPKNNTKEEPPEEDNTEEENKEKMFKIIKKMSYKIDNFARNRNYSCDTNALVTPTRFVVEIDTSDGDSIAQKNAKLVNNDSKSPWDNRDIKGYVIVERQPRSSSILHINLSDGVYGTSGEVILSEFKEDNIVANVAYPITPAEGIKCQLGTTN